MSFLKKLFGKKESEGDKIIKEMAERLLTEKEETGKVSIETYRETADQFLAAYGEGKFEGLSESETAVEISSYSAKLFSKNRKYSVHWQDGIENPSGWVNGVIQLREGGTVLFQKEVERPYACKISDNGIIVCNDSTIDSIHYKKDEVHSRLIIFSSLGDIILKKELTANIGDILEITSDGSVVVFDTLYSKTEEANMLFVYSVTKNEIIEEIRKESEVKTVVIDESKRRISVSFYDGQEEEIEY